jgi:tRNA-2-methylthio-N6-dimethylallyladenosine synthase
MYEVTNIFGSGTLHTEEDLKGKVYTVCAACLSIYSEFLSWANAHPDKLTNNPAEADHIVVLSCQVIDLAILNEFEIIEGLIKKYPGKKYYIGGCLARRFDIAMPSNVNRLDHTRSDYTHITNKTLITYAKPFWVTYFNERASEHKAGHLFRHHYPLRIGVGCNKQCSYCTIRTTRGENYELDPDRLVKEFVTHENVVLIADSPSVNQLANWCYLALEKEKPISIRNVEPQTIMQIFELVEHTAQKGYLSTCHVPIQSVTREILADMRRPINSTLEYVLEFPRLQRHGVYVATNIIINYKGMQDMPLKWYRDNFDYVSWNPLWDGVWNRKLAESRMEYYTKEMFEKE